MLKRNLYPSLLFVFYLPLVMALDDDRKLPIELDGPTCIFKNKEKMAVCKKGATITQGSLLIRSEHAVIYYVGNTIDRIEMRGKPVYFEQLLEQQEKMIIKSDYMDYKMKSDKVFLKGNVSVKSEMGITQSEEMEIDLLTQEITAGGDRNGGRFHMVIDPNKK